MSDLSALPPTSAKFSFKRIKGEQEAVYNKLQQADEEFWTNLKLNGVYSKLKTYIEDLCKNLDLIADNALNNGVSVEEVGVRTIVNKLTKANLMSIITKVERTAEVINARKQGGTGDKKG